METNSFEEFAIFDSPPEISNFQKYFRKHFRKQNLLYLVLLLILILLFWACLRPTHVHHHYHSKKLSVPIKLQPSNLSLAQFEITTDMMASESTISDMTDFGVESTTETADTSDTSTTEVHMAEGTIADIETTTEFSPTLTSAITSTTTPAPEIPEEYRVPRSCSEVKDLEHNESGIYKIYLPNVSLIKKVYCDMDTLGGGWTVIQRRVELSSSENFFRTWNEYAKGFGNLRGSFWLGLNAMSELTRESNIELLVHLVDWSDKDRIARYTNFRVAPASEMYKLILSGYNGNAGDSLATHNGKIFATKDKDVNNCANGWKGGWWYNNCYQSNLNGVYNGTTHTGIVWHSWHDYGYSLKGTEMKIGKS